MSESQTYDVKSKPPKIGDIDFSKIDYKAGYTLRPIAPGI